VSPYLIAFLFLAGIACLAAGVYLEARQPRPEQDQSIENP
jgi:hypothetical protein